MTCKLIRLLLISLTLHTFIIESPQPARAANPQPQRQSAQKKKIVKELQLLDRAWILRNSPMSKKLAMFEQLQIDLETQNHTTQNQSRIMLAQSLLLISEPETQIAAAERLAQAARLAPLKLNPQAAQLIWNEFLIRIKGKNAIAMNALADVAQALATSQLVAIDARQSFYLALSFERAGRRKDALAIYEKIEPSCEFYRQAKLHEGLIAVREGLLQRGKSALEVVVSVETTEAETKAKISAETLVDLKERAVLNLARLLFENNDFKESLSLYRSIDAQSPLFYESLSEQGWAFFMAGHPNRALGLTYGATSPHFNQQFQPDQYFLNAAVNYWLCDFIAARRSIQAFVTHTREDATLLRSWIASENNSVEYSEKAMNERAFKVVEGLAHGVSSTNSLLGPRGLQSLGRKTVLMNGISSLDEQRKQRLNILKNPWPVRSKKTIIDSFLQVEAREQVRLGELALAMIRTMRTDYERALTQIRMINLEIMTAEKDKVLGNERTAQGQQFLGSENDFLESTNRPTRLWDDSKREFWKDELDSFVFTKKSQCQLNKEEKQHAER